MARSATQFQKGLSLPDFQRLYGTEEQCEAALEKARWPDWFCCSRCNGHEHGLVYGCWLKRYQCRNCGHQATLTAGTIMQATKLPLATWFLALSMIGQPGQNRDLLAGAQPPPGRELRHGLAAAQQDFAGDG